MASLFAGFNYDIFISFRQKDNKYDGWVSQFADDLRRELEATFKEEISVCINSSPRGLPAETNSDPSLNEKPDCLIFIPVISHTYCDPGSFEWEHEFKAFITRAASDMYGLKIRLPGGNFISRILPVRIYYLDAADRKLYESVLGSATKGIDFIYREPGVNRPLTPDDDEGRNLEGTKYRNQINKTANAIKEIISVLKSESVSELQNVAQKTDAKQNGRVTATEKETDHGINRKPRLNRFLKIAVFGIMIIIAMIAVIKLTSFVKSSKTIAVIPFTNPVSDDSLGLYSIGYMDEIITELQEIRNLTVRSRFSSLQYLNTGKPLKKIRNELRIRYLIDVSIEGTRGNLKIWVGLTKTRRNKQIWANQYTVDEKKLVPLFNEIVKVIAEKLNVEFSTREKQDLEQNLTDNPDAFATYLTANARLFTAMGNIFIDSSSFVSAIRLYDKAIEYDPDFAIAYARRSIARSWGIYTGQLNRSHIEKCLADINMALHINKDIQDIQNAYGFYYYYCKKDYVNALISFNSAYSMDRENYQPLFYTALVYRKMGDWAKSQNILHRVIEYNPQEALFLTNIGMSYQYLHNYDSALIFHQKAIERDPSEPAGYLNKIQTLIARDGNTSKAHEVLDSAIRNTMGSLEEYRILLDIYDGKYNEALNKALSSRPGEFTSDINKNLTLATLFNLNGDKDKEILFYDSALVRINKELDIDPDNPYIHGYAGLAFAGKGFADPAINEGKRAIALAVESKDSMVESDLIINMALIYTTLGQYAEAFENIEVSLRNPSVLSVKVLKADPGWRPLLNRPEFEKIVRKYSKK